MLARGTVTGDLMDLPLKRISVSDFRRLEGLRAFPLDAPIVLIHGPNGAGKTSVLSALELALTGEIRSMLRQDPRYIAHLPFRGRDYATVRAEVADSLSRSGDAGPLTVGGDRVDGLPALSDDMSRFFAERCFLDQASLGRLLELYQHREGRAESALARFVNELLGLEHLDALREGLHDATDLRRLKNLCPSLAEADAAIKSAEKELSRSTGDLEVMRTRQGENLQRLFSLLDELGIGEAIADPLDLASIGDLLIEADPREDLQPMRDRSQRLVYLTGRIGALNELPSGQRLANLQELILEAQTSLDEWEATHGSDIAQWREAAQSFGITDDPEESPVLERIIERADATELRRRQLLSDRASANGLLLERQAALVGIEQQLQGAREVAGTFVEALAALRPHVLDDLCPICDRDYGEVGRLSLAEHLNQKIDELTRHGERLANLQSARLRADGDVSASHSLIAQLESQLGALESEEVVQARRGAAKRLQVRAAELYPRLEERRAIVARLRTAQAQIDELRRIGSEVEAVRAEIREHAEAINVDVEEGAPMLQALEAMLSFSEAELASLEARADLAAAARDVVAIVQSLERDIADQLKRVAGIASSRAGLERSLAEARRRQAVARGVSDAALRARELIVQRVFTQSLNDVWRDVFTRLAPREPYVPTFGIPHSTRNSMEVVLETRHTSGATAGAPQMMLSAGNLNTAALSLFIALHLAVDPLVPCLVFDDPVQSMDEIHVAQFAGLMRVLAKRHRRQVVVAVHERELFDYLSLELSPAFLGDELITIELGHRADDEDEGVTRHTWTPDVALAG